MDEYVCKLEVTKYCTGCSVAKYCSSRLSIACGQSAVNLSPFVGVDDFGRNNMHIK